MKHSTRTFSLLVLLSVLITAPAAGQQWTRFRGPNGDGQSDAGTIPATWTTKDYAWRVKLPGIGCSSPVVSGDKIFITCGIEEDATRIIRCLKISDGGLIWKRAFESTTHPMHQNNTYCVSTPALDADHVYTSWTTPKEYTVVAMTQEEGREVWRRDLGPFESSHGYGASPMLYDDLLILPNDQLGPSFVIALDRATGKTRWKVPRRSVKTAYSTPCIYRPEGGAPQLILTSTAHGVTSLDPKTGKQNWELEVFDQGIRIVGSPVVASGLIFASAGTGGGGKQMVAIRPGVPEKGAKAEVAYNLKGSLPYVPTSVAHGKLLFTWSDQGVVTCLDAPTGELHWQQRVGGQFFGSPIRVGDRLYCISRKGEMVVLAADVKYGLLGKISLEEPSDATPTVVDGVMYLRTRSHLMALGEK